jgi:hypothetical protein
MSVEPRISIIVLNFNRWKDTLECLESLYQIDYFNYDVILVDNGSCNDSIQEIREYASGKLQVNSKFVSYNRNNKPLKLSEYSATDKEFDKKRYEVSSSKNRMILIKNSNNFGFAGGNNVAINFALSFLKPDYILLLNNDTVVDRSFCRELLKGAESKQNIGIVGPKIYYYDFSGRIDIINFAGEDLILWKAAGIRYGANELDKGQHDKIKDVSRIAGACMLIKEAVFHNIGLLDPSYFFYWEETDFCYRAKRNGYRIVFVPTAKVWHKISSSISIDNPIRTYYLTRNKFIFIKKNATGLIRILFLYYFFFWDMWQTMWVSFLKRRRSGELVCFVKGVYSGLRMLLDSK